MEEWIDQAYVSHHTAPVPHQTDFQWKQAINASNCFSNVEHYAIPYKWQLTRSEYHEILAPISVVKSRGPPSTNSKVGTETTVPGNDHYDHSYNRDTLKDYLDGLIANKYPGLLDTVGRSHAIVNEQ